MGNLVAGAWASWILAMFVVALTLGIAWPLMAFVAMRNVGRIRRELERLNDILESNRVSFNLTLTEPGRQAIFGAREPVDRRHVTQ